VRVQLRLTAGGPESVERVLLTPVEDAAAAAVECRLGRSQRGRPRLPPRPLRRRAARAAAGPAVDLAAIERFNLVNDAWAVTVAGLMPIAGHKGG
jgi:hypothetical protein